MAGGNTGIATINLIGARITRPCTYVPGYTKPDGNKIMDKIYIPVAINTLDGKTSYYQLTAWGDKIAPLFAHYLRKGKEMHFLNARVTTFKWQMTTKEGTPVNNNDGTPLLYDRPGIVVRDFLWGADSDEIIAQDAQTAMLEVQQGLRGPNWKIPGHPDNINWKAREKARVSQPYQGGPTFGYAEVSKKSLNAQSQNAYNTGNNTPQQPQFQQVTPPQNMQQLFQHFTPPQAQQFIPPQQITPSATGAKPNVNGITYEQLIASGWTDPQIMANPQYAVLKTAHDAVVRTNVNMAQAQQPYIAPPTTGFASF